MNKVDHRLAAAILERASTLPDDEARTLIEAECRHDASLAELVLRLHNAQRAAPRFLADPTVDTIPNSADRGPPSLAPHGFEFTPGTRIGSFTIDSLVSRGGMGSVYRARQDKPERLVALKVLRSELMSAKLLRRFELEAEMLGRLQHPGIAQVFEAGIADIHSLTAPTVQVPYFAMEYIRGVPLDTHVREHALSPEARLELLAKICDAVEHAHQKGLIHRDLKPANILVTEQGEPKILDFGVARAIDADIQSVTFRTDIGQLVGTVPYMSPEQVAGDPNELDTRSDVYALGVVMFEMMTGRLPHAIENMSIPEAVRIIHDEQPARLSTIDPNFRGDIETIVGKSLEKERARRYSSASALAKDIRRYLANQPIEARPASAAYEFRMFARRNRGLVTAALVAASALITGAIGAGAMAIAAVRAAERERTAATQNATLAAKAQREESLQRRFRDLLFESVRTSTPFAPEAALTADELMKTIAARLDAEPLEDPAFEVGLRAELGATFRELGSSEAAIAQYHAAIRVGDDAGAPDAATYLWCKQALVGVFSELRNHDQAMEAAADLRRAVERLAPSDPMWKQIADATFAAALVGLNRGDEAQPLLEKALEQATAAAELDQESRGVVATACDTLGSLRYQSGDASGAETAWKAAVALLRPRGNETPRYKQLHSAMGNLSLAYEAQERIPEAIALQREVIALLPPSLAPHHPDLVVARQRLAMTLRKVPELRTEAETLLRQNVDALREIALLQPARLAEALDWLGRFYLTTQRAPEAIAPMKEALTLLERQEPRDDVGWAQSAMALASILRRIDRSAEGEPLARAALTQFISSIGDEHWLTCECRGVLGDCLGGLGRFDEAEPMLLQSVEALKAAWGENHESVRIAYGRLRRLYTAWERPDQAAVYEKLLAPK